MTNLTSITGLMNAKNLFTNARSRIANSALKSKETTQNMENMFIIDVLNALMVLGNKMVSVLMNIKRSKERLDTVTLGARKNKYKWDVISVKMSLHGGKMVRTNTKVITMNKSYVFGAHPTKNPLEANVLTILWKVLGIVKVLTGNTLMVVLCAETILPGTQTTLIVYLVKTVSH